MPKQANPTTTSNETAKPRAKRSRRAKPAAAPVTEAQPVIVTATRADELAAREPLTSTAPALVTPEAVTPEAATDSAEKPLTGRASRLAQAAAHIAAGAHRPNVRTTTSVRIGVGVEKYDFTHLAKLPIAARIAGLPAGSQAFYLANAKAYADRPANAAQLDNAKLARIISAGLATVTGARRDGLHLIAVGADPVLVTFVAAPSA